MRLGRLIDRCAGLVNRSDNLLALRRSPSASLRPLLWLGAMMAQFYAKGFRQDIRHRFLCFSLFWHALDIIWVAIVSLVYLVGTLLPELLP